MNESSHLYRLQCLDSEADARRQRLREIEAALGESEMLRQARRAVEDIQAQAQRCVLRQRDLELQVQGLADKIARSEQHLYNGTIKNPKELDDLQKDIASLRRRRQQLEDELLEVMIEREEVEKAHTQAQEYLGEVEAGWSAQQANLLSERDALQGRLVEIERARATLLTQIEDDILSTYQQLRRRKGGVAVAQVLDGACGACGVALSPGLEWQLRQGKQARCSNCERILVHA